MIKKLRTVGELIEGLSLFDKDTPLHSLGYDLGGYDASERAYCIIEEHEGYLLITHLERYEWEEFGEYEV